MVIWPPSWYKDVVLSSYLYNGNAHIFKKRLYIETGFWVVRSRPCADLTLDLRHLYTRCPFHWQYCIVILIRWKLRFGPFTFWRRNCYILHMPTNLPLWPGLYLWSNAVFMHIISSLVIIACFGITDVIFKFITSESTSNFGATSNWLYRCGQTWEVIIQPTCL